MRKVDVLARARPTLLFSPEEKVSIHSDCLFRTVFAPGSGEKGEFRTFAHFWKRTGTPIKKK
jgi:hypothetical protein